jgi:hypothetical protein
MVNTRTPYGGETEDVSASGIVQGKKEGGGKLYKGREFYWRDQNGKVTKTQIPVPQTRGTQLTVGPDGKDNFSQGNVGDLTPTNKTNVQKELISNIDRIDRIDNIISSFDSKFLETKTRMGMSWTALKESTLNPLGIGKKVTPEQKAALSKYTTFMKRAHTDFVKEVHDFAGGNMTKHELKAITEAIPNPGKGWFDMDSATEYLTASKDARLALTKIAARKHYYLNKLGYSQKEIDAQLDNGSILGVNAFMEMVDKKAQEYEQRLVAEAQSKGQPMDANTIKAQVKMFLTNEFGLRFRN